MRKILCAAAMAVLVLGSAKSASAASVVFDFEDGTDQGWGPAFGTDSGANFPISSIGGSQRMQLARTGAFQEASYSTGNTSSPFFLAMADALVNPTQYNFSYDWLIDTGAMGTGAGTFLQVGSFANTGSGAYFQDFGSPKEVELNGDQLASGLVFSGHFSATFASLGYSLAAPQTFLRAGLILNGNGANQSVYFDNVSISPVPEPTMGGLVGGLALAMAGRRRR